MHESVSSVIPGSEKRTQQVGLFPGVCPVCESKAFSCTSRNDGLSPSLGTACVGTFPFKICFSCCHDGASLAAPTASSVEILRERRCTQNRSREDVLRDREWFLRLYLLESVPVCLDCSLPHHNGTPAVPGQMNARGVLKCRCSHQYAARTLRQSNPYTHRRDLACWLKLTDAAFKARENTRPLRVSKYRLSPQSTRGCTGVAGRWGVELVNYWSMEQLAACGSCGFGALVGLWENHGRRGLLNTEPDCAHRDKKLN